MTDDVLILRSKATDDEDRAKYAVALKAHARRKLWQWRREVAKTAMIVGAGAAIVVMGIQNRRLAVAALGKEVVYAVLRDDGTLISSARFENMPSAKLGGNVLNSLWWYIEARECYDESTLPRASYIVQAMSDDRVDREYLAEISKNNPDSPQHVYGDKGVIVDCEFTGFSNSGEDSYTFYFDRWTRDGHKKTPREKWSAAIRYRTGVYPSDPARAWVDKSTFNADGVQVFDYRDGKPEGISHPKPHQEATR